MKLRARGIALALAAVVAGHAGLARAGERDADADAAGGGLSLVLLKQAPTATGAMCLDGSPPGYWIQRSHTTRGYVLHLEGGGWCWTPSECEGRAKTTLGSSTQWTATASCYGQCDGILSDDPADNPDFWNFTHVFVGYCDGSSFSSNQAAQVGGLWHRGRRNLDAVLDDLLAHQGMSTATDVIVTGGSAGGLAAYLQVDHIADRIAEAVRAVDAAATVQVRGLGDAGWFLDAPTLSGQQLIRSEFQGAFVMWNSLHGVNDACVAAHAATKDEWRCIFAEYTYEHIRTPTFILEGLYDSWQLNNVLQLGCAGQWGKGLVNCTGVQVQAFQTYGNVTMRQSLLVQGAAKPGAGMFASACIVHCQSIWNENQVRWNAWKVNGRTPAAAFGDWYFGRGRASGAADVAPQGSGNGNPYIDIDTCMWPCNPSCPFWTLAGVAGMGDGAGTL